ncbi:MAG: DUF116 domain-containing protein [Opitutaceae bacterium]
MLPQLQSDRRLGHEWGEWDGSPLPDGGLFEEPAATFFRLAVIAGLAIAGSLAALLWLTSPRLSLVWSALPGFLAMVGGVLLIVWLAWLAAVALAVRTGNNWLPPRLSESGLLPLLMPKLQGFGAILGMSRDRVGNSMIRVFNRLAAGRPLSALDPADLLLLVPRCLAKESLQVVMDISSRYGVAVYVASRGRHAREMIGLRRPRRIVAVACERDLVSGVHDVANSLPVLGTTLQLSDGPCRNTSFVASDLEWQVRRMLGLKSGVEGAGRLA